MKSFPMTVHDRPRAHQPTLHNDTPACPPARPQTGRLTRARARAHGHTCVHTPDTDDSEDGRGQAHLIWRHRPGVFRIIKCCPSVVRGLCGRSALGDRCARATLPHTPVQQHRSTAARSALRMRRAVRHPGARPPATPGVGLAVCAAAAGAPAPRTPASPERGRPLQSPVAH